MQKETSLFIKNKINELRKKDSINFFTNYFLTPLDDEIFCVHNENAIVFLQIDRENFRLFFAYINEKSLNELLKFLPKNKEVSLEIISKKDIPGSLNNIVTKYLEYETTFERMKCLVGNIKKTKLYLEDEIEFAKNNEIDIIYDKLYKIFNNHTSHLPDKEELQALVLNKQILVVRNTDSSLSAIVIYKKEGKQARFDQFLSFDNNMANTLKLWDYFASELIRLNFISCYLWVDIIYNKSAYIFYKYFGYVSDGLKNYVFINRKLKEKIKHK